MKRFLIGSLASLALAAAALAEIQHGALNVVEIDGLDTPASVNISRGAGGRGPWTTVGADSSRGDYVVDFGTGSDNTLGIMIVAQNQNSRIEASTGANPYFATVKAARNPLPGNRYQVSVARSPSGAEVNYNSTLAYFPSSDGWFAGALYNAADGGTITEYVGNPAIILTNPFDPNKPTYLNAISDNANGLFDLTLEGVDFRRDGVVLACGAKDEDNFAAVTIGLGNECIIRNHDNGVDGANFEQDPVAFAFIPDGTPGVIMGHVSGSARPLYKQGDWSVELFDPFNTNGIMKLTIPSESPSTGTLLTTAHNEGSGNTIDNPLWAEWDGTGWIITSRDMTGMGLQDLGGSDIAFVFAFFKNDTASTPVAPVRAYEGRLDDLATARFTVTEFTSTNNVGDCRSDRTLGSTILDNYGDNRGDFAWSYLNSRGAARIDNSQDVAEGMPLGCNTDFFRDNSVSGGISGWPTFSLDNNEVHTHAATTTGGEINSNYCLAIIPAASGLTYAADVQVVTGNPVNLPVAGDATTDGVLMAVNWDNNNRCVTATPNANSYDITCYEGVNGTLSTDWDYGHCFFPYAFCNENDLAAGQIAADGTVISGTGNFTVGSAVDGVFGFTTRTITIPGVNANTDGVLLITPTSGAYAPSWRPMASGAFEVGMYNLTTGAAEPGAFMFIWLPFEIDFTKAPALLGDMNCDGFVTVGDIGGFVLALTNPTQYAIDFPTCDIFNADVNQDGFVTVGDIGTFVALLTGGF
ncbi:MAG: hypothetical protein SF069_04075 [Phycisphaerae bacterium]|nr:hypothetical protein [Phycisphaerae bacterium]